MSEMKLSVEGLEKERDFYFNKVSEQLTRAPFLCAGQCTASSSRTVPGPHADLSPFRTVRSQLREIEIIIGARLEVAEAPAEEGAVPVTEDEKETLLQMQQILYSTEVSLRRHVGRPCRRRGFHLRAGSPADRVALISYRRALRFRKRQKKAISWQPRRRRSEEEEEETSHVGSTPPVIARNGNVPEV